MTPRTRRAQQDARDAAPGSRHPVGGRSVVHGAATPRAGNGPARAAIGKVPTPMRSARTLVTGAAVAATLLLGAPAALADVPPDAGSHQGGGWDGGSKAAEAAPAAPAPAAPSAAEPAAAEPAAEAAAGSSSSSGSATSEHGSKGSDSKHHKPHGGVHTGGGGLALSGGGAATGAVLLAGGVGVSVLAMRRRRTAAKPGLAL
ncbi:hypothetical protein GCM10023235_68680 [Kitasatospora terrestris]|uniref:Gram-positive cocci surface proteins LPxTG domain-containing protein n=2 Tax=Kitasatospora terrestris TaxID=258051 RepID=A0ABP9EGW9_9ACTN